MMDSSDGNQGEGGDNMNDDEQQREPERDRGRDDRERDRHRRSNNNNDDDENNDGDDYDEEEEERYAGHRRRDKFVRERRDGFGSIRRRGGGGSYRGGDYYEGEGGYGHGRAEYDDSPGRYAKRPRYQENTGYYPVNRSYPSAPSDYDRFDGLLPFRLWMDTYYPTMNPDYASLKYQEYKDEYARAQLNAFFELHKTEDWFLEKYHPERRGPREAQMELFAKGACERFVADFGEGKFADLDLDAQVQPSVQVPSQVLFVHSIPPFINRAQLEEPLAKLDGYISLEMSEANPQKKFHRFGWVHFDNAADIEATLKSLELLKVSTFEFHFSVNKPPESFVAPGIAASPERMKVDLAQVVQLAKVLNKERNLTMPANLFPEIPDASALEQAEVKKWLDLYICFLRQVHLFDYYSAMECPTPESLARRCGAENPRRLPYTGMDSMHTWLANLDAKIKARLRRVIDRDLCERWGRHNVENNIDRWQDQNILKEEDTKYRCKLCGKLFKGSEFVKKHLALKHTDEQNKVADLSDFFNNYVEDPNHLTSSPLNIGQVNLPPISGASMQQFMSPVAPPQPHIRSSGKPSRFEDASSYAARYRDSRFPHRGAPSAPLPFQDPRTVRLYADLDAVSQESVSLDYG